jgi:hypothetical protein
LQSGEYREQYPNHILSAGIDCVKLANESAQRAGLGQVVDLVSEREQSGQSVAAFCRDRKLAGSQFIYWKKRLREAGRARLVEVPTGAARCRAASASPRIARMMPFGDQSLARLSIFGQRFPQDEHVLIVPMLGIILACSLCSVVPIRWIGM